MHPEDYTLSYDGDRLELVHRPCGATVGSTAWGYGASALALTGAFSDDPTLMDLMVAAHAHREGCDR